MQVKVHATFLLRRICQVKIEYAPSVLALTSIDRNEQPVVPLTSFPQSSHPGQQEGAPQNGFLQANDPYLSAQQAAQSARPQQQQPGQPQQMQNGMDQNALLGPSAAQQASLRNQALVNNNQRRLASSCV